MATATEDAINLGALYEEDETAWLETMSALAARGQYREMDYKNLSEYLKDMVKRDRREVFSRLVVLCCHLLKLEHQPKRRSASWRGTIREQRRELRQLLESGTLRRHAQKIMAEAYEEARRQAADETGLKLAVFPARCERSLDELLAVPESGENP